MPKIKEKITKMYGAAQDVTDVEDWAKQLFDWCQGYNNRIYERGHISWRFYNGDQWPKDRPRGLTQSTFNIIGPHIDIIVANLTDSRIVYQVYPKGEEADYMSQIWDSIYEEAVAQDRFTSVNQGLLLQTFVKGYCAAKITHDPDRNIPVKYEVIHPLNFMAEPGVKDPEQDSSFFWHTEWMTPAEIRRNWENKYNDINYGPPGAMSGSTGNEFTYERAGNKDYIYGCWVKELWLKTFDTEDIPAEETEELLVTELAELKRGGKPKAVVYEDHQAHIDAHTAYQQTIETEMQQIQAEVQLTGNNMNQQRAKQLMAKATELNNRYQMVTAHIDEHVTLIEDYPDAKRLEYNGWRVLTFADDGGSYKLLDDYETPYTDDEGRGIHAFEIMKSVDTATDIYAQTLVEKSVHAQKSINRWKSKFEDHLNNCSHPFLGVDVTRLAHDPGKIRNVPAQILCTEGPPRDVVYWITGPQPSAALVTGMFNWIRQIELLTGVSDAELGVYPQMERASAKFVQTLTYQGRARWRMHSRLYEDFLQRVGRKMMYIIQKYMTGAQQIQLSNDKTKSKLVNSLMVKGGQIEILNDLSVGRWDVKIELKSMANETEEARMQLAIQLYTMKNAMNMPLLDPEGFAEYINDPILRETAKRVQRMWQQMATVRQQQGQREGDERRPAQVA